MTDERIRNGIVYARAAFIGVMLAGVLLLGGYGLMFVSENPAPKVERVKVPDLAASIAALGAPQAQGTLAQFGEEITGPCAGWQAADGFLFVCQP